jgi:hypothetical protein
MFFLVFDVVKFVVVTFSRFIAFRLDGVLILYLDFKGRIRLTLNEFEGVVAMRRSNENRGKEQKKKNNISSSTNVTLCYYAIMGLNS